MKLKKYTNSPIGGLWVRLSGEEASTANAALTETQKADIANGGWAKVDYKVGDVYWPGQLIKVA